MNTIAQYAAITAATVILTCIALHVLALAVLTVHQAWHNRRRRAASEVTALRNRAAQLEAQKQAYLVAAQRAHDNTVIDAMEMDLMGVTWE